MIISYTWNDCSSGTMLVEGVQVEDMKINLDTTSEIKTESQESEKTEKKTSSKSPKKRTTKDWNKLKVEEMNKQWEEGDDPELLEHEFERTQRIMKEKQKNMPKFDPNDPKAMKK